MSADKVPLPMWWEDFLEIVASAFVPESNADDVQRAKNEMSAAAWQALDQHYRFLRTLGLRQPSEQASFEAWAKENGYETRCIGPLYQSQRTKDAERGWMARGHSALQELDRGTPNDLRILGLTVAVHNDYRLNDKSYTFWLFTSPDGRAFKGEGRTDAEALDKVRAEYKAYLEYKARIDSLIPNTTSPYLK